MSKRKLTAMCRSGGQFSTIGGGGGEGTMSYYGGEAHATVVDGETALEELKFDVAEAFNLDRNGFGLKYFLPDDGTTLINLSSDRDVQRMIDFHEGSDSVDVFVVLNERDSGARTVVIAEDVADDVKPETLECFDVEVVDEDRVSKHHKVFRSWGNAITGVNQEFNDVHEVRDALRKYSIANGFYLKYRNNNIHRVTARCKVDGCPWRIHIPRSVRYNCYWVKAFKEKHTCGNRFGNVISPEAARKMVSFIVKEKFRDVPNLKAKEITDHIREEFGVELRYYQAWNGIEAAKEELQGPFKESYNYLPSLCKNMREMNPGSVVNLVKREDLRFHRLFVAFHASLFGFQNGCRPLLFLDTIQLPLDYRLDIVTATALDGNDGIFPLAFGVVDIADDDNWGWFLLEIKSALSSCDPITFIADRQLRQPISKVFENSYHSYCLEHLAEDLKEHLKTTTTQDFFDVVVPHLYDAAIAVTLDGFRKCMETIRSISPDACEWILKTEPKQWANSLFEGSRYNHFESRVAKSFYGWVNEPPALPIAQLIDKIRRKQMGLLYSRKVESDQWVTRLTLSIEDRLQKEMFKAQSLQVLMSPSKAFEVRDYLGSTNFVKIDTWDCTCKGWQLNGFPCFHAVAAIRCMNREIHDYCSRYFKTEAYRFTYLEPIHSVPAPDLPEDEEVLVLPPPPRPNYAPPKQRRTKKPRGAVKRPLHCSKCKGVGHNRATCHVYK